MSVNARPSIVLKDRFEFIFKAGRSSIRLVTIRAGPTVGRLLGRERIETTARYTTRSEWGIDRAISRLERDVVLVRG